MRKTHKIVVVDKHYDTNISEAESGILDDHYDRDLLPEILTRHVHPDFKEVILPPSLINIDWYARVYFHWHLLHRYNLDEYLDVDYATADNEALEIFEEVKGKEFDLHFDADYLGRGPLKIIHSSVTGEDVVPVNPCYSFEYGFGDDLDLVKKLIDSSSKFLLCEVLHFYDVKERVKHNFSTKFSQESIMNHAKSLTKWCFDAYLSSHPDLREVVLINTLGFPDFFDLKSCFKGVDVLRFNVSKMSLWDRLEVYSEVKDMRFFVSDTHAGAGFLIPILPRSPWISDY